MVLLLCFSSWDGVWIRWFPCEMLDIYYNNESKWSVINFYVPSWIECIFCMIGWCQKKKFGNFATWNRRICNLLRSCCFQVCLFLGFLEWKLPFLPQEYEWNYPHTVVILFWINFCRNFYWLCLWICVCSSTFVRDIYVVSKVSVEKRFYALLNSVSLMFWHNETKLGDFADLVGAESFLDHKENLKEEEMTCRQWTILWTPRTGLGSLTLQA